METVAILLAAGRGSRFESGENKVFHKIGGMTLLERAARPLLEHPAVSSMVVVGAPGEMDRISGLMDRAFSGRAYRVVQGGDSRQASSLRGLRAAKEMTGGKERRRVIALIHDAARCFLGAETVTSLLETIGRFHCGTAPAVMVTDTIRLVDEAGQSVVKTLPRDRLAAMQTPQGADLDLLLNAAELAEKEGIQVTDDLELLIRIGFPVRLIKGDPLNIKITSAEDLILAEASLLQRPGR